MKVVIFPDAIGSVHESSYRLPVYVLEIHRSHQDISRKSPLSFFYSYVRSFFRGNLRIEDVKYSIEEKRRQEDKIRKDGITIGLAAAKSRVTCLFVASLRLHSTGAIAVERSFQHTENPPPVLQHIFLFSMAMAKVDWGGGGDDGDDDDDDEDDDDGGGIQVGARSISPVARGIIITRNERCERDALRIEGSTIVSMHASRRSITHLFASTYTHTHTNFS